jgi:hypothetical protein
VAARNAPPLLLAARPCGDEEDVVVAPLDRVDPKLVAEVEASDLALSREAKNCDALALLVVSAWDGEGEVTLSPMAM